MLTRDDLLPGKLYRVHGRKTSYLFPSKAPYVWFFHANTWELGRKVEDISTCKFPDLVVGDLFLVVNRVSLFQLKVIHGEQIGLINPAGDVTFSEVLGEDG